VTIAIERTRRWIAISFPNAVAVGILPGLSIDKSAWVHPDRQHHQSAGRTVTSTAFTVNPEQPPGWPTVQPTMTAGGDRTAGPSRQSMRRTTSLPVAARYALVSSAPRRDLGGTVTVGPSMESRLSTEHRSCGDRYTLTRRPAR
jgi:hypothetical protein